MISHFIRNSRLCFIATIAGILLVAASGLQADVQRAESTSENVQAIVEYPASVTPEDLGSIKVTFRNLNAFEVLMIQTEGLFFFWKIEVRDASSGDIIEPSEAGRALLGSENASMIEHVWLKQGESTSWSWRIDSLYALPPGAYRISINRQFLTRGGEPVDVTLPAFEVEVKT